MPWMAGSGKLPCSNSLPGECPERAGSDDRQRRSDVAAAALPQVSFEPKLLDAAAQAFLACKAEAISPNRVRGVAENSSKPADHMGL